MVFGAKYLKCSTSNPTCTAIAAERIHKRMWLYKANPADLAAQAAAYNAATAEANNARLDAGLRLCLPKPHGIRCGF